MTAPDHSIDADELIRDAYSVVAEPEKLFDLQLRMERAQQQSDEAMRAIRQHIEKVGDLFDAVHLGPAADFSQMALVPEPKATAHTATTHFLTLDRIGRVAAFSGDDISAQETRIGEPAPEWLFGHDPQAERRIAKTVASGTPGEVQYYRLYRDAEDERGFMAMAHLEREGDEARIVFSRIGLDWDEDCGDRFAQIMGLSETELALTQFIVSGRSVNEFAETRGRAVGTARNQLKAIQRKLGIASQTELVSLYAGFANSLELQRFAVSRSDTPAFGHTQVLEDGSTMEFTRYGKAGGRPVILLHGAIEGPFMPQNVQAAAHAAGLELFVPWMPFYSDTDRSREPGERIERFVTRLDQFCEALQIECCGLLACSVSCAYGFAAAKRLPHRFVGLVAMALPIPLDEIEQLEDVNPIWRAPLVLGRSAPGVVDMLVRAVVRLSMRGEAHRYFDRLLQNAPLDHATLHRPDVAAVVRKAFTSRPDKAQRAMAHALLVQCVDWRDWLVEHRNPVRIVIGAHDSVHKPETQVAFCKKHGFTPVGPLTHLGGFSLFQDPARVFAEINMLMDDD